MYCHKCGSAATNDSKFCENCGASLTGPQEKSTSSLGGRAHPLQSSSWHFKNLFEGRLGRMRYFQGSFVAATPFLLIVMLWGFATIFETSPKSGLVQDIANNILIPIFFGLTFIFFIGVHLAVSIRRCHDLGYTGWLGLCSWIPYVGFIFGLVLLFKTGTPTQNEYGPPSIGNRKWLAEIFNY